MATQITPLPTPPSRQDPANFSTRADAFLGKLPTFATEANLLAVFAETKANEAADQVTLAANQVTLAQQQVALATEQADSAETSAFVASGAANYKGDYSSSTTYTIGQSVSYNGSRFIAKKTNLNITPNEGVNWLKLRSSEIIREQRTSNVSLTSSDFCKLIDVTSGTFTQTFAAAATLGNGWWCYIRNSGTGDITLDPNASETIDGLTSYVMYPCEVRLVQCDGTALRSVVLNTFYKTFTASGTFVKPPGYSGFEGLLWGGGGSGGKASDSSSGGGGGGGGACVEIHVSASNLAASESISIASGGVSVTTSGTNGNVGGNSTFSFITAYGGGGGGGQAGSPAPKAGGSGGGALSAGITATSVNVVSGGSPYLFNGENPGFGGASSSLNAAYGGAGGGHGHTTGYDGDSGGRSIFGGGGGGGSAVAGRIAGSGGASRYGGNGGSGGVGTGSGVNGTAPGGGGGGTCTGASSGAGARGELRIWGII